MYAENLEAAEEVIRRLFDPRRTYKKGLYIAGNQAGLSAALSGKQMDGDCGRKSGAQLCYRKNQRQRALCAHGQQYAGQRALYDAAAVSAKNQLLFAGTRAD